MFPPYGQVVQLVRTPACHAGGRGFEPHLGRQFASVAQLVEQRTENPRVVGSTPTGGTICGRSSSGRARPCQGRGSEFEPRRPLQKKRLQASLSKACKLIWRHSQVVRQRTANPRFPGSNPGDASKNRQVPQGACRFYFFTIHLNLQHENSVTDFRSRYFQLLSGISLPPPKAHQRSCSSRSAQAPTPP